MGANRRKCIPSIQCEACSVRPLARHRSAGNGSRELCAQACSQRADRRCLARCHSRRSTSTNTRHVSWGCRAIPVYVKRFASNRQASTALLLRCASRSIARSQNKTPPKRVFGCAVIPVPAPAILSPFMRQHTSCEFDLRSRPVPYEVVSFSRWCRDTFCFYALTMSGTHATQNTEAPTSTSASRGIHHWATPPRWPRNWPPRSSGKDLARPTPQPSSAYRARH
jgi:hypothetical protein